MKITLLYDKVLIKPEKGEQKTKSGLFIPDTAVEKPMFGIVSEVPKSSDITVKKGDRVLYQKHAGQQINLNGDDYLIMKETDIIAIL